MNQHKTITVNGQTYDATTGLPMTHQPVAKSTPSARPATTAASPKKPVTPARNLHATNQRSKTLRRSATKPSAPVATPDQASGVQQKKRPIVKSLDIARHPQIRRHNSPTAQTHATPNDIAPRHHPHTLKAAQHQRKQATSVAVPHISAKDKKDAEIAKALASTKKPQAHKESRKKVNARHKRLLRISAMVTAVLLVVAIVTWINLPTISVKIASAQAGVSASVPRFSPDAFTLQLPITADDNAVIVQYHSDDKSFQLSQEKSAWNSEAVRTMVEQQSKGKFLTTNDRGLTVYSYGGNAAWVNKGVLYTITGGAGLSSETIMRIATSL